MCWKTGADEKVYFSNSEKTRMLEEYKIWGTRSIFPALLSVMYVQIVIHWFMVPTDSRRGGGTAGGALKAPGTVGCCLQFVCGLVAPSSGCWQRTPISSLAPSVPLHGAWLNGNQVLVPCVSPATGTGDQVLQEGLWVTAGSCMMGTGRVKGSSRAGCSTHV